MAQQTSDLLLGFCERVELRRLPVNTDFLRSLFLGEKL